MTTVATIATTGFTRRGHTPPVNRLRGLCVSLWWVKGGIALSKVIWEQRVTVPISYSEKHLYVTYIPNKFPRSTFGGSMRTSGSKLKVPIGAIVNFGFLTPEKIDEGSPKLRRIPIRLTHVRHKSITISPVCVGTSCRLRCQILGLLDRSAIAYYRASNIGLKHASIFFLLARSTYERTSYLLLLIWYTAYMSYRCMFYRLVLVLKELSPFFQRTSLQRDLRVFSPRTISETRYSAFTLATRCHTSWATSCWTCCSTCVRHVFQWNRSH